MTVSDRNIGRAGVLEEKAWNAEQDKGTMAGNQKLYPGKSYYTYCFKTLNILKVWRNDASHGCDYRISVS